MKFLILLIAKPRSSQAQEKRDAEKEARLATYRAECVKKNCSDNPKKINTPLDLVMVPKYGREMWYPEEMAKWGWWVERWEREQQIALRR